MPAKSSAKVKAAARATSASSRRRARRRWLAPAVDALGAANRRGVGVVRFPDPWPKARRRRRVDAKEFRVRGFFRDSGRRARTREGDAKPSRRGGGIDGVLVRDAV